MSTTTLMQQALESALSRASLRLRDLDGLVVVLSEGSVSRWPSWPAMPCLADIYCKTANGQGFNRGSGLASPCIPHGYNRVAEWQMETYACVIVACSRFLERRGNANAAICTVVGGGEASGPLFPALFRSRFGSFLRGGGGYLWGVG